MRRVQHRTDTGEHRAAEQRSDIERQFLIDPYQRRARHHGVFGKSRAPQMMIQLTSIAAQPPRSPQQRARAVGLCARHAQSRPAFGTGQAMAAGWHEHHHHVVARCQVGHVGADLHHHAGGFVAEHHRHGSRAVAVDDRQVRMAQPGRGNAHQHLTGTRWCQLDLANGKRHGFCVGAGNAHLFEYCSPGSHCVFLRARSWR